MKDNENLHHRLGSSSSSCNDRSSSSTESTVLHKRNKEKGLTRKLIKPSSRSRSRKKGKPAHYTYHRSQLTLLERLLLSSWEKWKRHRRFPYKLFLHVSLLTLTLLQIGLYDAANSAYIRTSLDNW